ncbi:MAG TPA: hypothetical protein VHM91_02585 [Verrucomicrobiales bacterium]|jgi:hypothetical protein|nr:hypothetical protein [Verrucomicrobiales bacterium]
MNLRCFLPLAAIAALPFSVQADEALNKLMAGHEQALRSARLPVHRKLLTELLKLQAQYQKAGNAIPLSEVEAEITRVKAWIAEASLPVAGGTGPQPGDFKLVCSSTEGFIFGSWENGELKVESRGFSWTNSGGTAEVINTKVLTGAFEAEINYTGAVYAFSAMEADYTKYVQMFFNPPPDTGKHSIKVKRTAAGAMTAEYDGKPVVLNAANGARQDMHVRLSLRVAKGAKVEFREFTIKDLSAKK